jgi:hypothetical protein
MNFKKIKPHQVFALGRSRPQKCLSLYASTREELEARFAELEELCAHPSRRQEWRPVLQGIRQLSQEITWPLPAPTLGMFVSELGGGYTHLPFAAKSLAVACDTFHVKPLLKWTQRERPFLVLSLIGEHPDLYEGNLSHLRRIARFEERVRHFRSPYRVAARRASQMLRGSSFPLVIIGPPKLTAELQTEESKPC